MFYSNDYSNNLKQDPTSRWRKRLEKELSFRKEFETLDKDAWILLLKARSVTSKNHDTVLSLDWPHYCAYSTIGCGGPDGWCYTFQGKQASKLHNRHAAMVDVLASNEPVLFGKTVDSEVRQAVNSGLLPYPNIRIGGSGEVVEAHISSLGEVAQRGIIIWGFTRNIRLAKKISEIGAKIIISCDRTSKKDFVEQAIQEGFPIGYTSMGVEDHPPVGTLVTFPIHRVGRVQEVVDTPSLCPKVLSDYFEESRPEGYCQYFCRRCHMKDESK